MTEPKAIIVTAADKQYTTLAKDLIGSLRVAPFKIRPDIGMLDVGLDSEGRNWFEAQDVRVVPVKSDIDYPLREKWEAENPGHRTLTARPFLRDYFPGYDVYIWIDADMWVQTPEAIDTMIVAAADSPAIHICAELDRCYTRFFEHAGIWQIYRDWYRDGFGEQIAGAMTLKPMLNAGTFAMSKNSPVWEAWATIYTDALRRQSEKTARTFMVDQLGLNILLYLNKLPYVVLPAAFNWMTFYALPAWDDRNEHYVEPLPPYRPLSQLHLTRQIKEEAEKISCIGDGDDIERPLTWRGREQERKSA
jgi:hypothetical protein